MFDGLAIIAVAALFLLGYFVFHWFKIGLGPKAWFAFWQADSPRKPVFTWSYKWVKPTTTDEKGRTLLFRSILKRSHEAVKLYYETNWGKEVELPECADLVVTVDYAGALVRRVEKIQMLRYAVLSNSPNDTIFLLAEQTDDLRHLEEARETLFALKGEEDALGWDDRHTLSIIDRRIDTITRSRGKEVTVTHIRDHVTK